MRMYDAGRTAQRELIVSLMLMMVFEGCMEFGD